LTIRTACHRDRRGRLRTACVEGAVCLLLAGCSSSPLLGPGEAEGRPGSSLLLITLDTTRADRLGAYGGDPAISPSFDALARRGILFESCDSASPLTLPSHATLLTGLYPPSHGLRTNGRGRLPESIPTLATLLSDHGFRTAAFVSSSVLDRRHGLNRGFDLYDDRVGVTGERRGDDTVRRALAWLEEVAGQRFFLWLHLFDPHAPYRPPEPYARLYRSRPYEGEIAFTDALLGRLLGSLPKEGGLDRSPLICVVGDHGEGLGDHGEEEHGLFLYQTTLAVPLVLAGTGLEPGRVHRPVRTVDLFPSLLSRLGIPPPAGSRPGRDLLENRGPDDPPARSADAYAETLLPRDDYGWSPLFALRSGHLKVVEGVYAELFDLRADPGEENDLLAGVPHGHQITGAGRSLLARLRDLRREGEQTAAVQDETAVTVSDLEHLRTLGYLGGSGNGAAATTLIDPREQIRFHNRVKEALVLHRDGDHEGAARELRALLREQPRNPLLLDLAGSVALARGRAEEAVDHYRASLRWSRDRGPVEVHLAEALLAAGRPAEAEKTIRRALEHLPSPPSVRAALALCRALVDQGRPAEARREATRFAAEMPADDPRLDELLELAGGN
jgi:arylsulfatase A-like enzyme/Flp pilus assembly protein TadD